MNGLGKLPRRLLVATRGIGCRALLPEPSRPEGAAPGQGSWPGELRGAGPAGATHPARCSQRTPRCSGAASTWLRLPPAGNLGPRDSEGVGGGCASALTGPRSGAGGGRLSPQRLTAAAQHARAGRCPSATGRSRDRKGHASLSPF